MRIAIVGSGIAGLGAAHFLAPHHDVHVFEASDRAGGHANTVRHTTADGRTLDIDTGFLVHNRENYPQLVRLFRTLGVATQESTMSFSVVCDRCGIQYSGARPWAQPGNLTNPRLASLFAEIARFIRRGASQVHPRQTLAQFCDDAGYTTQFRDHFLLPLAAALWSTSTAETFDFPASYAIGFFENHGMLRFRRFQWRTVTGGSRRYVDALIDRLPNGVNLSQPVHSVRRHADGVDVRIGDRSERFDALILASHPDQSLAMLDDPSPAEHELLGAFSYVDNDTVLHTDTAFLPSRRSAQASWNYRMHDCANPTPTVTVTYDISRLQRLPGPERYLVTLNRAMPIDPSRVIETLSYSHPRYTFASLAAQQRIHEIDGVRRTWFCGAWRGYGFHEDGLRSALEAARSLGGGW